MATPIEKGNALEASVAAIERAILSNSPSLREKTFLIESKKHINVDGVHHEIDVFVTIDLGKYYKAIFIFECKNWTDAVGKNEIIVFSEKIDASRAQKGFFVAKSFTSDAEAQALKDTRIALLKTTEHDASNLPVPFDFHAIVNEITHAEVGFFGRILTSNAQLSKVDENSDVRFQGNKINLQAYVNEWALKVCGESTKTFPSGKLPEGVYDQPIAESKRDFAAGDFLIDGKDMGHAILKVTFRIHLQRPAVVSHFEVESRGHALSLAPITFGAGRILTTFTDI